jgi:hypothetical protein
MGEPLWEGAKVIPRNNVRSLFFCLSGHGGSFASVPRTSPKLERINCDLCGTTHARRPQRDATLAASHWVDWLQEDFNTAYSCARATQSAECDETLCEEDCVITPFGPGVVKSRLRVPSPTGAYEMPLILNGNRTAPIAPHKYLYSVRLSSLDCQDPATATAHVLGSAGGGHAVWKALSVLQLVSMLSRGRLQLPAAALQRVIQCIGDDSSIQNVLTSLLPPGSSSAAMANTTGTAAAAPVTSTTAGNARAITLRRDCICLSVGRRQENHYHSSIQTREWAFGMPHSSGMSGEYEWSMSGVCVEYEWRV